MLVAIDFNLNHRVVGIRSFCPNVDVGRQPKDRAVGWRRDADHGRPISLLNPDMDWTGKSRAAKGVHRASEQSIFAGGRIAPHQTEWSVLVAPQKMIVRIEAHTLNAVIRVTGF